MFTRFWADHDGAAGGWTDCVIDTFIYLLQTFVEWHLLDSSHHIQLISYIFLTRKDSVNVLCWEKVTPEPFDHVVMSCCLPGGEKKVFFVDRSGVVKSVLKLLFIGLCRRKKRL